ncbi:MAG TPA: class II D-tagatose-bisphosphate aldolase, non-catalytic subunit [Spirochaetia bacterium]|nr:class II D-tagatose-bisphosphate aldolase, non-catalytic subunit [Spirochaetia bacterium]
MSLTSGDRPVSPLVEIVASQKRGEARGLGSVCSSLRPVLEAAVQQALEDGAPLLVESTCNQVNQFGGYSGLTPVAFVALVRSLANASGLPGARLVLGGDHLGPYPFRGEPAQSAMAKAAEMVRAYIAAGYRKLHLDASMRLADDPGEPRGPLDVQRIAERCADLCSAAEAAWAEARSEGGTDAEEPPVYVIGTDVPTPGGSNEVESAVHVTTASELQETIETTRRRFLAGGLVSAWERVIAVVVQPGVEFGDQAIVAYDRRRSGGLIEAVRKTPRLVMEGHSTDYQTPRALRELVEDGVAILKVGPALSAAAREAVFLLAHVEEEICRLRAGLEPSGIGDALEEAMIANPVHWQGHYTGDENQRSFARRFSLLDRVRYYWGVPEVERAMARLFSNLRAAPIPLPLLSQYLPQQHGRIRAGALTNDPGAMLRDRIREVLRGYSWAAGFQPGPKEGA